ncbi:MAG: carbohydrate kinase [Pyrinomonadaceae bacterium]|nr:carbohydrate kinase [Pyrinomonadaceae bacterium]
MSTLEKSILKQFSDRKILIVGDLVADQFLEGKISRVSREAPVFILRHETTDTVGGGAANAAANVASLGGTASIVGVVGTDSSGAALASAMNNAGVNTSGVVEQDGFETTTKLRVLAGQQYALRQQVIRIDYEDETGVSDETLGELQRHALRALKTADGLLISDYGYGVADSRFAKSLINTAAENEIPVFVDSRHRLLEFEGATAATPNKEEVEEILETGFEAGLCETLRENANLEALLVTLGNEGMNLFEKDSEPKPIKVIGKTEPVDVTGAGDTVIAAFTLGVAAGYSFSVSARIANHAGGIVVMKNGTATVSPQELLNSIREHEPGLLESSLQQAG